MSTSMHGRRVSGVVLVVAIALCGAGVLAGDLAPPAGPVAPTMKTLTSVEPRIEVNALNTPTNGVAIYVISSPGSYYLGGNVAGESGKHGVWIGSSDVTLDLNGFGVIGAPGSLDGVSLGVVERVVVLNGSVQGWGWTGVHASALRAGRLERLEVSTCGFGIWAGTASVVADCTVGDCDDQGITTSGPATIIRCTSHDNGMHGIVSQTSTTISDCRAMNNGGWGIIAGPGATVEGSTVSENFGGGVIVDPGSAVRDTVAFQNTGSGIRALTGCTISRCTARGNGVDGIEADDQCFIEDCTTSANADDGISFRSGSAVRGNLSSSNHYGFYDSANTGSRIEDNTAASNTLIGFYVNANSHVVVRNVARSNDIDFSVTSGSQYGALSVDTGPVAPEVGAWANFAQGTQVLRALPAVKSGDKLSTPANVCALTDRRTLSGAPIDRGMK